MGKASKWSVLRHCPPDPLFSLRSQWATSAKLDSWLSQHIHVCRYQSAYVFDIDLLRDWWILTRTLYIEKQNKDMAHYKQQWSTQRIDSGKSENRLMWLSHSIYLGVKFPIQVPMIGKSKDVGWRESRMHHTIRWIYLRHTLFGVHVGECSISWAFGNASLVVYGLTLQQPHWNDHDIQYSSAPTGINDLIWGEKT